MAKKNMRICCVCHREYNFCPVCNSEDANKPSWHFAYCSENCKEIYEATAGFEDGRVTNEEAMERLEKLDLSHQHHFGESYQKTIAKIMKAQPQHSIKKDQILVDKKENKKPLSAKRNIVTKASKEVTSNVE